MERTAYFGPSKLQSHSSHILEAWAGCEFDVCLAEGQDLSDVVENISYNEKLIEGLLARSWTIGFAGLKIKLQAFGSQGDDNARGVELKIDEEMADTETPNKLRFRCHLAGVVSMTPVNGVLVFETQSGVTLAVGPGDFRLWQ